MKIKIPLAPCITWPIRSDGFGAKIDLVPEKDLREEIRSRVLSKMRYVKGLNDQ